MVVVVAESSCSEALQMVLETFHVLKSVLHSKVYNTSVGDEVCFAPNLKSNDEAIELILEAINKTGYKVGDEIAIALDPASSEMFLKDKNVYQFFKSDKSEKSSAEMVEYYENWIKQYPIISLEDGLAEDDWKGWKLLTEK